MAMPQAPVLIIPSCDLGELHIKTFRIRNDFLAKINKNYIKNM